MEKGRIIFGHVDGNILHDYFKTILQYRAEKFCAALDVHIVQLQDDVAVQYLPNSHIFPAELSHTPVRVIAFEAAYPYLHPLLTGFAEYIQQTVEGSVCLYVKD